MTQNNVIAGALLGGFLVFITVRGELPSYARLFSAKRQSSNQSTSQDNGSSNPLSGALHSLEGKAKDYLIEGATNYFGLT